MLKTIAVMLALVPGVTFANQLQPVSEIVYSPGTTFAKYYELTNRLPKPTTYIVEVLEKDMTPAAGWRTDTPYVRLMPGQEKIIWFQFKTEEERKLVICTTSVAVNDKESANRTRVCSKLWIK